MRTMNGPPAGDATNTSRHHNRAGRRAMGRASMTAITLTAVVSVAVGCSGSDSGGATTAPGQVDLVAGEQTYKDFCGSCHGRDFEGSSQGPSHLDAVYAPELTTDDDYRAAISNGAPEKHYDSGPMPAIGSLDDQETANVIAYVRQVQEERGLND